jgi:hypothetical protein
MEDREEKGSGREGGEDGGEEDKFMKRKKRGIGREAEKG